MCTFFLFEGLKKACADAANDLLLVYKITGCFDQNILPSFPQLPNICGSDVTCKLEMIPQGHCLEYNYDYDNGFSICRI